MTPTPEILFEGQKAIGGILNTGANVMASFKPFLTLIIGVLVGFFVIYLIILIVKNLVFDRLAEQRQKQVFVIDIIDNSLNQRLTSEIKEILSGSLIDIPQMGQVIGERIKKYKKIKNDIIKNL